MADRMDKCSNCYYWDGDRIKAQKYSDTTGRCHKNPVQNAGVVPQQSKLGRMEFTIHSCFPTSFGHEWCGEFKQHDSPLVLQ